MTPAKFIREYVFKFPKQSLMEPVWGVDQSRISKLERGAAPLKFEIQENVLRYARSNGIAFDPAWFFDVPKDLPEDPSAFNVPMLEHQVKPATEAAE